jgi:hypothetical protein
LSKTSVSLAIYSYKTSCNHYGKLIFPLFLTLLLVLASPTHAKYSGGTGDPCTPYKIGDFNDLMALRADSNDWDKCFILTDNIDLDPCLPGRMIFTNALIAKDTGTNSGFQGTPFTGVFDGNSHDITNLTIDSAGADNDYLGLFGSIRLGGEVKNLGIVNFSITGGNYSDYLGGLCGDNDNGIISNCHTSGSVNSGGSSDALGGLCGGNSGIVKNCYAMGLVNGDSYLGGLCGFNTTHSTISNCYATVSVSGDDFIGGLCGMNAGGTINNCYASGPANGDRYSDYLGGLCGENNSGTISNSYFLDTSGPDNGLGSPLTDTQMRQKESLVGFDFAEEHADGTSSYWIMEPGDYPTLSVFCDDFTPHVFEGAGNAGNPYLIYDANDLGAVWQKPDCYYRLENDIDLAGIGWSMSVIGFFSGNFDGNDHVISNLEISADLHLGLFGELFDVASVHNLGIEDVNVSGLNDADYLGGLCGYNYGTINNCYVTGPVSGGDKVGGLCGYNEGTTDNCYAIGAVTGGYYLGGLCGDNRGTIDNCYASGSVTGGNLLGGLCGYNDDRIDNSYATCTVSGDYALGGLCGMNDDTGVINKCYATGSVSGYRYLGGFCGENDSGVISNSYATGSVSGDTYSDYLGGFCGKSDSGTINNCYATGFVSGGTSPDYLGGLFGDNYDGTICNCYFLDTAGPDNGFGTPLTDSQMKQQESFIGFDFPGEIAYGTHSTWIIEPDNYPSLSGFDNDFMPYVFDGQGNQIDPYRIYDVNDLGAIQQKPDCYYRLENNIDLSGTQWSVAVVDSFTGTFDGNDHVISNLVITGNHYLGLFGELLNGASVQNLGIEDVNITSLRLSEYVGGLCGYNEGAISNCRTTGSVSGSIYLGGLCGWNAGGTIINCYATDYVSGERFAGGLCGTNYQGTITNCHANGIVNGTYDGGGLCANNHQGTITNCYATGLVSGVALYGGLCGKSSGILRDCYATGSVSGTGDRLGGLCGRNRDLGTISNCYATGSVSGGTNSDYLGGLSGENSYGAISNCYATGSVSGGNESRYLGGLCGYINENTISNCYATGSVSGGINSDYLGGLCGDNSVGTINGCYFLDIAGPDNGFGTPLGDDLMKQQASFVGWDFSSPVWKMNCPGESYPKLSWWEPVSGDLVCPDGVNFIDYSYLVDGWVLVDPVRDLDGSELVDANDVLIFCDDWLEGF